MSEQARCDDRETEAVTAECRAAERLFRTKGPEATEAALLAMAERFPGQPEPREYLAMLHRTLALKDSPRTVDRRKLRAALDEAKRAAAVRCPPLLRTLRLVRQIGHDLALHAENAEYFAEAARTHPDAETRFHCLCWSAVALQCLAAALSADGDDAAAEQANRDAVRRHREALAAWTDAPIAAVVSSYSGESHIVRAYADTGRGREWIESVEGLLAGETGRDLPALTQAEHLTMASDVASENGLGEDAIRLAGEAAATMEGIELDDAGRMKQLAAECALLRGCHVAGRAAETAHVAERIMTLLGAWERAFVVQRAGGPPDNTPAGGYNVAARNFITIGDWDRAIAAARRATKLWDFGANHFFLATALWAGRKDRVGTLGALRNAARDARLSGEGGCRNLRIDFLNSPAFADVRDDPEFLRAIEVRGVIE